MSAPGRKRRPKGDARRDSLADKDDRAVAQQRSDKADLIARMKAKQDRR